MTTKAAAGAAAVNTATDNTDEEKNALFGGMSDEERANMTDEELAAIDGDDDDDSDDDAGDDNGDENADDDSDQGDADGDDAGEEGDDDGEAGEDGSDDDAGEGEGEGDAGAADDAGDDTEDDDDDEEDDLDVTRSVTPNEWQVPKDADEQLKALNGQATDLADKFDAGDLTAREYHEQREALDDQRSALKTQLHDATKNWNKAMGDWSNRTVRAFLREHKEYDAKANPTLNRMLDGEVRALQANTADPFNPRILRRAHENIQKALGKTPAPAAKDAGKPGKAKTPVVPGKKPQVPPTLARVPQDQIDDAEGGKFARLNRLESRDPHAFEEAFAKMSPADQDDYLAGA